MSMPKSWDEYEIKARYIPCLISVIPLVHFLILLLGVNFWKSLSANISWLLVVDLSLSVVITVALIQVQCDIAKHWIEESIFGKGGKFFPTTDLLLFSDQTLSRHSKMLLRKKVLYDFQFNLMDEKMESSDKDEARRLSREAIGFIRGFVVKGRMTHQYNIRYGFMRNLMGGFLWAIVGGLGSSIIYWLSGNWQAVGLFAFIPILYLTLLLLKRRILNKLAYQYAETLLNEYLTIKGG
jgi:hypothetical protein